MSNRTELLVRISELYYQQQLSQQEISKITNISRPTISRLLEEAKDSGIVEIIVHSPIVKHAQLSNALRTQFQLRDAIVVAGEYEYPKALKRCAEMATRLLSIILENNQTIGISWGRALDAFCEALPEMEFYNVNVVQMVGCLGTGNPRIDGLELALRISKKLYGTYSNIYAPVHVDSSLVYSYLTAEPQIEATLRKAAAADVVITGIGTLDDTDGTLFKSNCYPPSDREKLKRQGAVASILARWVDAQGREINLDDRFVISAPLSAMKTPAWSIGINASAEKAASTLAVVRGGYVNTLVVDEPLAREMLRLINP